jgi:hypothetical protein
MNNEPFFSQQGNQYLPTRMSVGPWSATMLHGRVAAGLLAFQIEREHGSDDFLPSRLTVDMYRAADLSPIDVVTRVVREGQRIKVIDAECFSKGTSIARATCQLLRKSANSPGAVWQPPTWQVPAPLDATPPNDGPNAAWEIRGITGSFGSSAQRRVWMRDVRELVAGAPLTPWVRAALIADFASPCSHAGDQGLGYINSDLTLYLHRLPRGEWLGMETVNHGATDGIAVGDCFVYDEQGPIGSCSVTALANRMMHPK